MTSVGTFAVVMLVEAPPAKDVDRPPASMRFRAEADGGMVATCPGTPRSERDLSSPYWLKMRSMALKLLSRASFAALLAVGVFAREVPRLRALPKGPFSSGTRRGFLSALSESVSAHVQTKDRSCRESASYSANSYAQGNFLPVESNARSESGTA